MMVFVSDQELIELDSEYDLKLLLQSKGVPFAGYTNLQLDPNYVYWKYRDPVRSGEVFRWDQLTSKEANNDTERNST